MWVQPEDVTIAVALRDNAPRVFSLLPHAIAPSLSGIRFAPRRLSFSAFLSFSLDIVWSLSSSHPLSRVKSLPEPRGRKCDEKLSRSRTALQRGTWFSCESSSRRHANTVAIVRDRSYISHLRCRVLRCADGTSDHASQDSTAVLQNR